MKTAEIIIHVIALAFCIYALICVVYFFIQEKFIFVPTFNIDPFTNKIATPSEEFHLETPNHGSIHALLLKCDSPNGVVIYLHGNTGNLKRWQFMAEEISAYGFDVFVPDFRGYGQSKGKRSEAYMHRDMESCYEFVTNRYPNQEIIIYGRSLGTGFATRLASRKHADKVVLETPFYNMLEVAAHYLPFLPVKLLLRYRFRSDLYIQHIVSPILILHGTKDIVVPHAHALRLFRQAEAHHRNVRMITIVNGKHGNLNSFPLFRDKLEEFLLKPHE
ncbi:MAG: alpha/beta hydrolase [Flavobacteriales bacterium]|nr:alpha/beta hydrolase [Flavobacteriales bacterium]